VVLEGGVEADCLGGCHETGVEGELRTGQDGQPSLFTAGMRFDDQGDDPVVLVADGRSGETFP
jgi:hypothetical protein